VGRPLRGNGGGGKPSAKQGETKQPFPCCRGVAAPGRLSLPNGWGGVPVNFKGGGEGEGRGATIWFAGDERGDF